MYVVEMKPVVDQNLFHDAKLIRADEEVDGYNLQRNVCV